MSEDTPVDAAAMPHPASPASTDPTGGDSGTPTPDGEARRRLLLTVLGIVLVAVVAVGSFVGGMAVASSDNQAAPIVEPTVGPRGRPDTIPPAVALRTCSVGSLASHPELEDLYAAVLRLDGSGSETLYAANESSPVPVGGVMKLYTAAAALRLLGGDYRIATSVVEGTAPGSVVLVGRGDATLSRLPVGQESVYPGAPKLASLAGQVVDSWADSHPGELITQLVVDTSYWNTDDNWSPAWPSDARSAGTMPYIVPLMVDGDRDDPTKQTSKRGKDPVTRATDAFIAELKAADPDGLIVSPSITVANGAAMSGAPLLAEVQSQTVATLVQHMLRTDDNTLAEMLSRVMSRRSGMDGSMSSVSGVIVSALTGGDIPIDSLTVDDGSGLSPDGRIPMADLATFLRLIQDGSGGLSALAESLSVAGKSGSLADRFTDSPARNHVSAKTGRNTLAAAMAGIVEAKDGSLLAFAVSASREGVGTGAWGPMDALVAGFYSCGTNLAAG